MQLGLIFLYKSLIRGLKIFHSQFDILSMEEVQRYNRLDVSMFCFVLRLGGGIEKTSRPTQIQLNRRPKQLSGPDILF